MPPKENGTGLMEAMVPVLPELITLWLGGGMDMTVADLCWGTGNMSAKRSGGLAHLSFI